MTGYSGIVHDIIRRGTDAYQVTLGIYPGEDGEKTRSEAIYPDAGQLLLYRADIVIDDNRTILFPDRELDKCMDTFFRSGNEGSTAEGLEKEWMVSRIVDRICRELRELLLERGTVKLT
ncbi:MAG TPA: hypothetical protein PL001_07755 [Candidatus Kryptobacter bacterium]|nr:hypothetical protein [Candidatus Kryptobacter bacterium]